MSPQHRELCGIISALQTNEFYIIGSPFPIYLYCDHRPILFLWSRKGQLSHRFFKYQVVLTKFHNLKIMYTPGTNLAFPDLLSRNVPIADIKKYQIEHKTIPNEIKFVLDTGEQINYSVLHKEDKNTTHNDCYPIIAQLHGGKRKLIDISEKGDFSIEEAPDYYEESCNAIQNITDFFNFGKQINQIKKLSTQNMYEEIPEELFALDDDLDNQEWIELCEGNVEQSLIDEFEQAKQDFENRTKTSKLIEPISLHSEKGKNDSLDFIFKLTDFAKTAALDVETIVQEQLKDPVVESVKKWVKRGTKPETKPHRPQDKAIRAYLRQFDLLFIENQNELLCIHEYNDDCSQTPKICLPLSLFLNSFKLAHSHPISGHHGETKH